MELKLPYGLKDGKLVTINDVVGGLACGCCCPNCNEQVIARKGAVKIHHFAHYEAPECTGSLETTLHKICKDIIFNYKEFATPPYPTYKGDTVIESTTILVDNVSLEKRLDVIVPDIIIESQGKKLLVEIEITHPVNEAKLQKIKSMNLPVICIDARRMVKEMFERNDYLLEDENFRKALTTGIAYKRWLSNPKGERILQ